MATYPPIYPPIYAPKMYPDDPGSNAMRKLDDVDLKRRYAQDEINRLMRRELDDLVMAHINPPMVVMPASQYYGLAGAPPLQRDRRLLLCG